MSLRSLGTDQQIHAAASLEEPDHTANEATAEWMEGIWLFDASLHDLDREACSSGTVQSFEKGGVWHFFNGSGTWDIFDGLLVQVVQKINETSYVNDDDYSDNSDTILIGKRYRQVIRRVGPNEGTIYADGAWRSMLRCRLGDY